MFLLETLLSLYSTLCSSDFLMDPFHVQFLLISLHIGIAQGWSSLSNLIHSSGFQFYPEEFLDHLYLQPGGTLRFQTSTYSWPYPYTDQHRKPTCPNACRHTFQSAHPFMFPCLLVTHPTSQHPSPNIIIPCVWAFRPACPIAHRPEKEQTGGLETRTRCYDA